VKKVLCFSSSHRIGLTDQLVEQGIAYLGTGALACVFIAGEGEQHPGLRAQLRAQGGDLHVVNGLDEHREAGRLIGEIARVLRSFQPDIVSLQTNWQLALAVLAAARARHRSQLVYTINGYRHNHRARSVAARFAIGAALLLFASRVIAPSRFLAQRFRVLGRRLRVIPLGASESFFRAAAPPDFSVPLRLMFAGEFRQGKNQDVVIRAFAKYLAASGDSSAELVLPGAGPLLESCRSLARRLGLEGRVVFPGFLDREEIVGWYLRSQSAVVPTNVETFGHCIVEPLVLGRLVLSRRVGCAEDVIVHGENGLLFDTEQQLVELLLRVGGRRADLARLAARALGGRERFRWATIARRHVAEVFT
jgi:glycosyltransferase involved in cell wall biosynthesis